MPDLPLAMYGFLSLEAPSCDMGDGARSLVMMVVIRHAELSLEKSGTTLYKRQESRDDMKSLAGALETWSIYIG